MFRFTVLKSMALLALLMLTACATIVGTPTQLVPISSTPSDAKITVVDESGVEVFKGMTPTTVTLHKSTGNYWGKKSYVVTIAKDGFKDQQIPITASANGWYMFGNILFGGLIGYFVVDPFSGNMYTLSPENITADLAGSAAHINNGKDRSISIVLLQDVPSHFKDKLVRVR